jgi:heme exporter protein B
MISVVRATQQLMVPTANEPPWIGLLIAFDVIFLSSSMLMFQYVVEE